MVVGGGGGGDERAHAHLPFGGWRRGCGHARVGGCVCARMPPLCTECAVPPCRRSYCLEYCRPAAAGFVYLLNLLMSFQMGAQLVSGHRKKPVKDARRLAYYYMR